MPTSLPIAAERPTWLDWMLRPFSKVKRGEGLVAALLLVCVFLILTSYYLMKTAREGMILTFDAFGLKSEELKSYAGGAMALLLFAILPAYDALASRVRRIRLITVSYAIVIGCLVAFFVLAVAGVPIGLAFFIWIGIVNMFLVAQFWSYANDVYTEEQGKRLFPIIAIGGSLGAIVGPQLSKLGSTYALLPFAAALLVACIVVFNVVDRAHDRAGDRAAREPVKSKGGFSLVLHDRYLILIAALVLVAELVKTTGEFVLSSAAIAHAGQVATSEDGRREAITAFYADFFFWVNILSFVIQAFLVSRVIEWFGVRKSLFILPLIVLGAYGAIALIGGISLIRWAKTVENGTEYSLQNNVRQALFLPTDRGTKYKAKAAIDTFVVRIGDTLSALVVWVGIHVIGLGPRGVAASNVVLVAVWLAIAVGIARQHRKISREPEAA
jgi:ATP:ADP antiporter, AAA family